MVDDNGSLIVENTFVREMEEVMVLSDENETNSAVWRSSHSNFIAAIYLKKFGICILLGTPSDNAFHPVLLAVS
jgi:hypothetical protein